VTRGKVYLVGAGPGAPDLITVRGAELLKRADIVFYDSLVHPDTLAIARNAKKVLVGKRCSRISTDQRFINRCLIEAAHQHQIVVRLKGGDPMLFGRATEEIAALKRAGVECEIVPGVTAAVAASAELKVSLTQRGVSRSVAFVTPRVGAGEVESNWAEAVIRADTAVLYMGAGQAAEIARALLKQGMSGNTPVSIVQHASLPESRRIDCVLSELANAKDWGIAGPAVILLGEVLKQAEVLQAQSLSASA
jgi:uroporphyrin-III C-methyltransferase